MADDSANEPTEEHTPAPVPLRLRRPASALRRTWLPGSWLDSSITSSWR